MTDGLDGNGRRVLTYAQLKALRPTGPFAPVQRNIEFHLTGNMQRFVWGFDGKKNKRKHGIDFEEAQELWADSGLVEIPARTTDEPRIILWIELRRAQNNNRVALRSCTPFAR